MKNRFMPASAFAPTSGRSFGLYRGYIQPILRRSQRWLRSQLRFLAQRSAAATMMSENAALVALQDATPRQRWEAAAVLGRHSQRSNAAIAALLEALADPEPFVRWQAAEALAAQEVSCVFHALTDLLIEGAPRQRAGAAEALGKIGGEAATTALCKQVADPESCVRQALAKALGQIGDPTTVVELAPMLDDADCDVQRAAAQALGQIGNPGTAVSLAQALARPDQPVLVRRSLAAALVSSAHPDAQPALLRALADPDPQVRGYAAQALGHIGDESAYEQLAGLLSDQNELLKGTVGAEARAARTLLERRGRRAVSPAPAVGTQS